MRSAASHTGSLTSSSMVVDAACAAIGAHRVDHPPSWPTCWSALREPHRMSGRGAVVLTDGGGHGAVAADALVAAGLRIPVLTGALTAGLEAALWAQATVTNPVDLAGAGEQEVGRYARGRRDPAGLRPGRRRAADRLLRRLLRRPVRPGRAGARRGPADGGRGPRPGQAARRADDPPGQPRQPCVARGGHPGPPGRRPCVHGAGRRSSSPCPAGLAERPPGARDAGHRLLVRAARARCSRTPESPSPRRSGRPMPPAWRTRSTRWASRSCSRRPAGSHKSEDGGVVVGLADRDARGRRTPTCSRGWRRRPCPSSRWPTCPTGSS